MGIGPAELVRRSLPERDWAEAMRPRVVLGKLTSMPRRPAAGRAGGRALNDGQQEARGVGTTPHRRVRRPRIGAWRDRTSVEFDKNATVSEVRTRLFSRYFTLVRELIEFGLHSVPKWRSQQAATVNHLRRLRIRSPRPSRPTTAHQPVHDPSGFRGASIGDGDAPLFAPSGGSRPCPRPDDDPAGLLHNETELPQAFL